MNDMMNLPWCRIWSLNNLSELNFLEQYSQIKMLSGSVSIEKEEFKIIIIIIQITLKMWN